MPLAFFGVSFLTPTGALFVLAAAAPIAALFVTERRSQQVREALRLPGRGRRALLPVAIALVLLPALVAVAAAQPVVVRQQLVRERGDAQAFFVLDTSLSMKASAGPGQATRLQRAKRLAARLEAALGNVPVGLASFTDRVLPNLMPTTDPALFDHTLTQSIGIDRPPPTEQYGRDRATNFQGLVPIIGSHFFSDTAKRRLLVVFTDGEAARNLQLYSLGIGHNLRPVFVHVWAPGERIFNDGRPDPHYAADPTSASLLEHAAVAADGTIVDEHEFGRLRSTARHVLGQGPTASHVNAYARVALAPWVALAGILPLGFLFYRRNF